MKASLWATFIWAGAFWAPFQMAGASRAVAAQVGVAGEQRQLVVLDTDIGDDIDDAFALALVLKSPELKLLGITTTYGNTRLRARLVERFLQATGNGDIPVAVGRETKESTRFTQKNYAEREKKPGEPLPAAVDFLLDRIKAHPGEITLIAIGPLVNVGDAIDKDPATFRQLKRVVLMGGSISRGYGDLNYLPSRGPTPEYNIDRDIAGARKLFHSGVPIYMMPLDSTQLKLDEVKREVLFQQATPYTDELTLLYHEWGHLTPTLYDAMAVAYAVQPGLCPTRPMHIEIDAKGNTRPGSGPPNAFVCLHSDPSEFFSFYIPHFLRPGQ